MIACDGNMLRTTVAPSSSSSQVGQCPAGAHNPSLPGATPGPAIRLQVARLQGVRRSRSLCIRHSSFGFRAFDVGRVRNLVKRRGRESRDSVGSTPTPVTALLIWRTGFRGPTATTPARHAGDDGSIPSGITRRVTEGSRIRVAGPVC